jgi:hypothetical protein
MFVLATVGFLRTSAWFGLFGFRDGLDAQYARVSLFVEGAGAFVLAGACVIELLGCGPGVRLPWRRPVTTGRPGR